MSKGGKNEQLNFNAMSEVDLATHYIEQLKEAERLAVRSTELNKRLAIMNSILYAKMEEKNLDELTIDKIKFKSVTDENYSLEEGTRPWNDPDGEFYKWLHEIGEEKLIKQKLDVNAKTRDSFLTNMRKEKISLPEFIKISFFNRVKFNKSEIRRRVESEI